MTCFLQKKIIIIFAASGEYKSIDSIIPYLFLRTAALNYSNGRHYNIYDFFNSTYNIVSLGASFDYFRGHVFDGPAKAISPLVISYPW